MSSRTAVLEEQGAPLRLAEASLHRPGPGEVVVELGATGVCHSDVAVFAGELPARLPLVLGHEGAGRIVEVGDGVTGLAAGDQVVLSVLAQCGHCDSCRRGERHLCAVSRTVLATNALPDGRPRFTVDGLGSAFVGQFCGLGTFAERIVVLADAVVKVPAEVPMPAAALIGCGVLTGFGAAVNTARVRVGDIVAVVGCGGVGLSAVQGARVAGAAAIIAVDMHQERLDLALSVGATHGVLAAQGNAEAVRQVKRLTAGRGADIVLETAGRPDTVQAAVAMSRRGGSTVLVGAVSGVAIDDVLNNVVMAGRTIRGCVYGSSDVQRDVPLLIDLYRRGELKLDELVTETFDFTEMNDAVGYCAAQRGARAVVVFQ